MSENIFNTFNTFGSDKDKLGTIQDALGLVQRLAKNLSDSKLNAGFLYVPDNAPKEVIDDLLNRFKNSVPVPESEEFKDEETQDGEDDLDYDDHYDELDYAGKSEYWLEIAAEEVASGDYEAAGLLVRIAEEFRKLYEVV